MKYDYLYDFSNSHIFYLSLLFLIVIFPLYITYIIKSKKKSLKPNSLYNQIINMVLTIIIPLVIASIYIIFFFRNSFSSIYNNNITRALSNSYLIADTYYKENQDKILNDILIIARTINSTTADASYDNETIKVFLESYSNLKELSEAVIFIPSKNVIMAKNEFSFSLNFDHVPLESIEGATIEKPILIENLNYGKIRAIIELENFPYKTYLMIGRYIDEKIIQYVTDTKDAMSSYNQITKRISDLQNIFLIVFATILILLILALRFLAQILTKQLVEPINNFIAITQKEDFSLELEEDTNINELNILIHSFNTIMNKLHNSKKELDVRANFIEEILAQAPYGLMVVNNENHIIMQNNAAKELMYINNEDIGTIFLSELSKIIHEHQSLKDIEQNIDISDSCFLLKITRAKLNSSGEEHFLVIFTNITEHITYQKSLLWIEIAKRITHEIRNPLTPIILSAERIEYKYLKYIDEKESDNFLKYIENIKRHTSDIARIIDEFIEFGKMPQPKLIKNNLIKIIQMAINGAHFDRAIRYNFNYTEDIFILCDENQMMRALLNLFKNSWEAMVNVSQKIINIDLKIENQITSIIIKDSGLGFPDNLLSKIAEPYITTKIKGSGLGLSIVKKIIDEHNGTISFTNDENHHAVIIISL